MRRKGSGFREGGPIRERSESREGIAV